MPTKKTTKTPAKKEKKLGATVPKKVTKPYHLEIRVNGIEFITDATDFTTALLAFVDSPVFPFGAKTKTVITYSKGKSERTRVWQTPEGRRILRTLRFKDSALSILAAKLTRDVEV